MNTQQNSVSENNFEQCIKCTVCTVYCPVAAVNQAYPGPKQAGPDGERLRLKRPDYFDEALKYCLNCKRCEVACPSNVRIGDIIQSARIKYSRKTPSLRDFFLANTDLVGSLASPFAPVVNGVLATKPVKYAMDKVLKVDHRRMFPKYSSTTFESWYRRHAAAAQEKFAEKVAYFHGCYVNYNNPSLGKDLIKVLNALGIGVRLLEKEKCCGVALVSNGLYNQARKQAAGNTSSIRKALSEGVSKIVSTSSTCTFTIRDEYPHLLDIANSDIRDNVELAVRYIYRLMEERGASLRFRTDRKLKVAYHTPCHMEKMGWAHYSVSLLKMIPGVELTVLDSQCCGIAGTYGFKKENYETSQAVGESLFRQIEASGADIIATDCETCKWQIEMSTSKKCENPITILASMIED